MSREFGHTRALLAVPVAVVVWCAVAVSPASYALTVTLALPVLVVVGVAALVAVSPPVLVDGPRLSSGDEHVDLTQLSRVTSVSNQGGLISGRGLPVFRHHLLLEDAYGGRVVMWAWGWTPREPLCRALREAVAATGARTDRLSRRRIGIGA